MRLGRFGVWASYRAIGEENAGAAARLVEELGLSAFWLGGSPQLPALRPLLAATERIVVATGILNVWQSDPNQVAHDFAELTAEFPGRVLVGIGIGHPEATTAYRAPVSAMREFLGALDRATPPLGREHRCLAALGPKMLELSRDSALGAHTYFVPVEHTRAARQRLGDQALLAPELAYVLDDDPETARVKARAYSELYLGLRNYTRNLLNHGFTQEDIAEGGSERLLNAIVPQGSAAVVAAVAQRHIDGGASHVCLQAVGVKGVPRAEWTALAQAVGATGG
jgi:probable F420-dependent oxidoreductase